MQAFSPLYLTVDYHYFPSPSSFPPLQAAGCLFVCLLRAECGRSGPPGRSCVRQPPTPSTHKMEERRRRKKNVCHLSTPMTSSSACENGNDSRGLWWRIADRIPRGIFVRPRDSSLLTLWGGLFVCLFFSLGDSSARGFLAERIAFVTSPVCDPDVRSVHAALAT